MSEYAQYPYEALQAVGSDLTVISDQIAAAAKDAFEITGLTADQDRIAGALTNFRTEWEASVQKLGENIGGFGDTSTAIGLISGQFDGQLATSLSPDTGRSSGSSGRDRWQ